jgi:hypothetical protein
MNKDLLFPLSTEFPSRFISFNLSTAIWLNADVAGITDAAKTIKDLFIFFPVLCPLRSG